MVIEYHWHLPVRPAVGISAVSVVGFVALRAVSGIVGGASIPIPLPSAVPVSGALPVPVPLPRIVPVPVSVSVALALPFPLGIALP